MDFLSVLARALEQHESKDKEMLLIDKKKTEEEQEEMGRNTGDGGAATIELEDATHILSKKKSTPMNAYKCTNNYTPVFTETARARRPDFSVEALKAQFTFPLKTAAHNLGICEAALKRQCRRQNVKKWPYRQLHAVLKRMEQWEETLRVMRQHEAMQPRAMDSYKSLLSLRDHAPMPPAILASVPYKMYDIRTVEKTLAELAEQRDTFYDIPPPGAVEEIVVPEPAPFRPIHLLGTSALLNVTSSSEQF